MTQSLLAQTINVPTSEMTRIMQGKRPNDATFRALCNCWPDRETGLDILRAHLEDEIERAGRSVSEVSIGVGEPLPDGVVALEHNLRKIQLAIRNGDQDLIALIGDLARGVGSPPIHMVAESPPRSQKKTPQKGQPPAGDDRIPENGAAG